MKKWYVVFEGRVPGVYDQWEDCLKQVNKFKGNSYKGYKTKEEAETRYMIHLLAEEKRRRNRMKTFIVIPFLLIVLAFLLYLILV
jgi:viroplasmin and RNaseH domain-containing protein